MKKIFKAILDCKDIVAVKNCVTIMAENIELGMSDRVLLDTLMQLRGEVGSCNFDEDTARLHLCIIGGLDCIDTAMTNFCKIKNDRISEWDFVVLWAEMIKANGKKIRKWFPRIREIDFDEKILDECVSFLGSGKLPYYDLKL